MKHCRLYVEMVLEISVRLLQDANYRTSVQFNSSWLFPVWNCRAHTLASL